MKNKCIVITLLLLLLLPNFAYASTSSGVQYYNTFMDSRNEYRLDYWGYSNNASMIHVKFVNSEGSVWESDFPSVTGIFYMTCNGIYDVTLLNGSQLVVGSINGLDTSMISNGTCSSYSADTPRDELGVQTVPQGFNTTLVSWTDLGTGTTYSILKDGALYKQTGDVSTIVTGNGSYTVIAKSNNGSVLGESDFQLRNSESDSTCTNEGICACIETLKPLLSAINENTNGILTKVTDLLEETQGMHDTLKEFKNQFITETDYPVKSTNDYTIPTLDDYKPLEQPSVFTDTTTYFTDQGDAEAPPAFPVAPEPTLNWTTHTGEQITQQPVPTRSPVMTKQPNLVKSPNLEKSPSLNRDPVMERDTTQYELRWKSSEYHP